MALLFFGPLAIAIVMYYVGGDQWRPSGSVAHGILLSQPRTLPTGVMILPDGATADFGGKWSLLYVGRGDCDDACKETLYRTRQVRRALGKEMSRVQRFFISTSGAPNTGFLAADHPGLLVLPGRTGVPRHGARHPRASSPRVTSSSPIRWATWSCAFRRAPPMKDMHEDLALLLKASQIG